MSYALFDALQYAKSAMAIGFTEQQAEFQAHALAEIVNNQLVSKQELKHQLHTLEYRLTLKIGFMLTIISILAVIIKI